MTRTFHTLHIRAFVTLAVLAVAGCASTRPSTLLSLPSLPGDTSVRAFSASMPVLATGRIEVPEYLVSRRVRYKIDDSTVGEWPETYWAERIEVSISREFNSALQRRMPNWRVCDTNCTAQSPVAALHVAVVRLDYIRREKRLVGKVKLTLEDTGPAHQVLGGVERQYDVDAISYTAQAQAQAVSDLLRRAADDAASFVTTVVPGARPSVEPLSTNGKK